MKTKAKKYHGKRALLNSTGFHSTAAICAEVEDSLSWGKGNDSNGDAITKGTNRYSLEPEVNCSISDCDRKITLYFGFDSDAEMRNNLRKVDVIIDALTRFRSGLALEQERLVASLDEIG